VCSPFIPPLLPPLQRTTPERLLPVWWYCVLRRNSVGPLPQKHLPLFFLAIFFAPAKIVVLLIIKKKTSPLCVRTPSPTSLSWGALRSGICSVLVVSSLWNWWRVACAKTVLKLDLGHLPAPAGVRSSEYQHTKRCALPLFSTLGPLRALVWCAARSASTCIPIYTMCTICIKL